MAFNLRATLLPLTQYTIKLAAPGLVSLKTKQGVTGVQANSKNKGSKRQGNHSNISQGYHRVSAMGRMYIH
ncbi:hypothetical protein CVV73_27085 [Enterobacter hormaechei]|nr:hypothetical protein CVV73_27085 [Enterobacter hormaechei]